LIDAFNDVKSADGYILRFFTTAFTKRQPRQVAKTSYAQASQVRDIRKKISEILNTKVAKLNINDIANHLIQDTWTQDITEKCKYIYPLRDVIIRKVKVLKRPKIDAVKLKEMYSHDKKNVESGRGRSTGDEDAAAQNTLKTKKGPKRN